MHATTPPRASPTGPSIVRLDDQLDDLQRAMSKAIVLFGLGKISAEAYGAAMRPLKDARARLEAERARLLRNA